MCASSEGGCFEDHSQTVTTVAALVDLLAAQNERLKKALYEIKEFGYKNSGKGYSCAKMAEAALKEEE